MREHPIPQDITGYRFHIIGNMTLKQFAQMGVGCFIAFLFYTTNLLPFIKWPLIGLSIGMGALVAFVPFEERPLDHWLITFIKILYKPTKFYWKREAKIPDAFTYTPTQADTQVEQEIDLSPVRRQRIKEYLTTVNASKQYTASLDPESARISSIMQSFTDQQVTYVTNDQLTQSQKPNLKVHTRGLGEFSQSQQLPHLSHIPDDRTMLNQGAAGDNNNLFNEQLTKQQALQLERSPIEYRTPLATDQVAQDIQIPTQQKVAINTQKETSDLIINPLIAHQTTQQAYIDNSTLALNQPVINSGSATFNSHLPFPEPPTEPNRVVGMVLTPQNDLVNDAIVEIKNESGNTIRAVKTNALGQFFISTPLIKGVYVVVIEKEGLQFNPIELTINNSIIQPLEIRST